MVGFVDMDFAVRRALIVASAAVVATGLTYWLGVWTVAGQRAENRVFLDARELLAATGTHPAVLPVSISAAALLVVLIPAALGLARRRIAGTLAAVAIVLGGVGAASVLKAALPRPELDPITGGHGNSFPSGHVAMAMSFVLAVLLVTPAALRWLVAGVGAIAVCLVVSGTMIAAWHRPSDTIGAVLISLVLFLLAVAVLIGRGKLVGVRTRPIEKSSLALGAATGVVVAIGCAVVLLSSAVGESTGARWVELLVACVLTNLLAVAAVVLATLLLRPLGFTSPTTVSGKDRASWTQLRYPVSAGGGYSD
ncbi:MAG TPA: phosphatase PAP2 family protein [Pseudonocardiaceae bacterium]|nr:phosphatase PAP2 family protein [Pseudonocardiaceae bacterium]